MQVPLSDGLHDAVVEPVDDGGPAAYSVRLLPRRPPEPSTPRAAVRRDRFHVDDGVDRQVATAVRHGEVVAVVGAGGTGKLRTAVRTVAHQGAGDPLVVEPHRDPDWFATAKAAAVDGRGVVLRRVHESPSPSVAQVQALVGTGAPIALTADLDAAGDDVVAMVRRVATTVRLPGLAQTVEHLPSLVQEMLAQRPVPESATRFSPAVWDRLMAWHWPGNLAELHHTVALLARRAEGGTVGIDDLPDELRAHRRTLGKLESAEREAVAEALRAAGGNRSRAAAALGIGRNTLYRKMREFGIS
jgi:hypothetical protein